MNENDLVRIGQTDLWVSRIGVGTNRWGKQRKADLSLRDTFSAALEAGFTLFDSAEIYNFGGSEKTLGAFLDANHRPLIVTSKFLPLPWRFGKQNLLNALEASLKRLNLSCLDLYLIHMQWPPVPVENWMDALADVKEKGLVRAVGVSNFDAPHLKRAYAALQTRGIPLACNQMEYSLLKKDVESNGVKATCQELGVTLVAYRPFAGGFLTGKYSKENPPKGPRRWMYRVGDFNKISVLLKNMQRISDRHGGKPLSQVALNWLTAKGALPIPGSTKVSHVRESAGALEWSLSADEIALLDEVS